MLWTSRRRTGRLPAPVRRLTAALAVAAVLLALLSLGVPNVYPTPLLSAPESPVREFVDVSAEANLPTWFTVVVLALGGSVLLLVAVLARRSGERATPWAATGVVLLALSLDDLASLHERLEPVGEALGAGGPGGFGAWVLPGLLVGAALAAMVGWLALRSGGTVRRDLVLGLGLVLGAALGLEAVTAVVMGSGLDGRVAVLVTHVEELVEALGAVVLLRAGLGALSLRELPGGGLAVERRAGT